MNDSPGWASPGSAPSDGRPPENSGETGPTGRAPESTPSGSKWSKEQPPAGQWSAPSGTPQRSHAQTPPRQGRNGAPQGGWGARGPGGWGGPPPAAKPGVIPLRPLGLGDILDGSVSTARAHWRTVLGVTVVVAVLVQIADILLQKFVLPAPTPITADPETNPTEALRQSLDSMQDTMISTVPSLLIGMIGTLFTTALLTIVVSRSVLGRAVSLGDAWREAKPRLPHLLGLTLLLTLGALAIMTVGMLPGWLLGSAGGAALAALGALAAAVVVVWLWIRFSLASPALMLERQSIGQALRRSSKLVQGSWWRVFGIQLVTALLTAIVSMLIVMLFSTIALVTDGSGLDGLVKGDASEFSWAFLVIGGIGAVIASCITYPISAGVSVLLYIDQRIRREALDLDLARAAGLPGYDTEQSPDQTPGN
ncbi:glycerophosphoryl diester phosphodiesterase membrane domain-containing protein [Streptomyces sp. NBC_00237]|uniref:glycerophosphoryl diester phosphodiesterase membrane domain-containing protein n=1 Tax=Streptomyces sp. NBC_00237 TaxID=2975687 RepID=UPI00225716F7|nr:glycerophosphoryl diester phosphodiesterase membrane domain-containing protein [Streptomyces sp. NBC_00237]MCX5200844.1 glycerophosphoryl diester phosphodiesterase membrane domain-containing protein [Streptomyces sp. NBC_00237]